jgi:hypothetical protein
MIHSTLSSIQYLLLYIHTIFDSVDINVLLLLVWRDEYFFRRILSVVTEDI